MEIVLRYAVFQPGRRGGGRRYEQHVAVNWWVCCFSVAGAGTGNSRTASGVRYAVISPVERKMETAGLQASGDMLSFRSQSER